MLRRASLGGDHDDASFGLAIDQRDELLRPRPTARRRQEKRRQRPGTADDRRVPHVPLAAAALEILLHVILDPTRHSRRNIRLRCHTGLLFLPTLEFPIGRCKPLRLSYSPGRVARKAGSKPDRRHAERASPAAVLRAYECDAARLPEMPGCSAGSQAPAARPAERGQVRVRLPPLRLDLRRYDRAPSSAHLTIGRGARREIAMAQPSIVSARSRNALSAKMRMFSIRSARPVSMVIARSTAPLTAMQAWPGGSP